MEELQASAQATGATGYDIFLSPCQMRWRTVLDPSMQWLPNTTICAQAVAAALNQARSSASADRFVLAGNAATAGMICVWVLQPRQVLWDAPGRLAAVTLEQ